MRMRPITALLAALALLVVVPAVSFAQTPTPTATAAQDDGSAAEPPRNASEEVKAIYTDYSRDGVIAVCRHARSDLKETLEEIEPDFDRDFPDFREALEAGIQRHDGNRCEDDTEPEATATATATPDDFTFDDDATEPEPTPDDGTLPEDDFGDDGGAVAPEDGTLPPDDGGVLPEAGALPDATPAPVPSVAPATAPTPTPTPVVVTRSRTDALLVPGIIVAIALLGAAALAATAVGNRSPRVRHAWSEARFRVRGTWADFSDWLKLGR